MSMNGNGNNKDYIGSDNLDLYCFTGKLVQIKSHNGLVR